jgi:hypothetical protein
MRWWALLLISCGSTQDFEVPAPPTTRTLVCGEGEAPIDGCRKVGVTLCETGFIADGRGGCDGKLAMPTFGACGTAPWGSIKTTSATKYVDAASDGDGSAARPFRTVQQAIDAGATHVAIAAGTYEESLELKAPVTIEGRCASMVEIVRTSGGATPPIIVARVDATIRGVAIRGVAGGIGAANGARVTVEDVYVHDTASYGLSVLGGDATTGGTVRRSLFDRCRFAGVYTRGAPLILSDSAVRASASGDDGQTGYGVFAIGDRTTKSPATLTVARTTITGNRQAGILVQSSQADISATVISDTSESSLPAVNGYGIYANTDPMVGKPSVVTLRDVVLARNHNAGINLASATMRAERITVRDTLAGKANAGFGIVAWGGDLSLLDSALDRNVGGGIDVFGATASIERTLISNTATSPDGSGGYAVASVHDDVGKPAAVVIVGSRLQGSTSAGVLAFGSSVTVDRCQIEDTRAKPKGLGHGDGIALATAPFMTSLLRASGTITSSVITKSARAGVVSWSADVSISNTSLTCNGFDLEQGGSEVSNLIDGGANVCGCASTESCRAQSHALDPIAEPPKPI